MVQNFTLLGGCADCSRPFTWSRVSGLMQFRDGSERGTATMQPSPPGTSQVTWAGFTVVTLRQSNNPPSSSKLAETEKGGTGEEQSQEHVHHFLWHKEFCLVGRNSQSAYYSHVWRRLHENMRRLHSELWRQKNWMLHQGNALSHTSIFTREFLTKNNMAVVPHSP
jgi:hypothetical protein